MACEILPFLSGTLRGVIQELDRNGNKIANEILRIDDLVNKTINVQPFVPSKIKAAFQEKIINSHLTGEASMLTIRMDGSFLISFLPKDKTPEYSRDGVWARKNRQEGRIGKVFQAAIKKQFSQREWELFVNAFKSEICQCNNFELVSGEDIRKWYLDEHYYSTKGSLGNSCMRHSEAQDFFDIYVDHAKMLITTKDGKLTGRAIVWEIDENTTILDRIYVCYDYLEQCFTDYAKQNKWIIRENNSLLHTGEEQMWLTPDDDYSDAKSIDFSIKLNKRYSYYPYVDSFRYLSEDHLLLTTQLSPVALDSTDGGYSGESLVCDNCGRTFYNCDEDDLPDELHWSEWAECYLCDDCCYWSEYLDDYIPNHVERINVYAGDWDPMYLPKSELPDYLVTTEEEAKHADCAIVCIDNKYYELEACDNIVFNKETEKYEIRPNSD